MQIQGFWQVFFVGAFGGFLVELLRWYKLRDSESTPVYATKVFYWVLTALMIVAGGGLAVLYGTGPINAVTVANIGASAPALIGALAAPPHRESMSGLDEGHIPTATRDDSLPTADQGSPETHKRAAHPPSVRQFLAFRA